MGTLGVQFKLLWCEEIEEMWLFSQTGGTETSVTMQCVKILQSLFSSFYFWLPSHKRVNSSMPLLSSVQQLSNQLLPGDFCWNSSWKQQGWKLLSPLPGSAVRSVVQVCVCVCASSHTAPADYVSVWPVGLIAQGPNRALSLMPHFFPLLGCVAILEILRCKHSTIFWSNLKLQNYRKAKRSVWNMISCHSNLVVLLRTQSSCSVSRWLQDGVT